MMKPIFLGSVVERSGKSMITLGVAKNYTGQIGYFKPFKEVLLCRGDKVIDQDSELMRSALNLDSTEEELCPFNYDLRSKIALKDVLTAYSRVKGSADLMLIEGTRDITTGCMQGVSGMAMAEAIGADVILITNDQPQALDRLCMLRRLLTQYGLDLKGVILNMVKDLEVATFLKERNYDVLGTLPSIPQLRYLSVKEIADLLNADVLVDGPRLEEKVEHVVVGAMTTESAVGQMRRVPRKALVTGGDRSDIQLAALMTDTACLVLTGGLLPERSVVLRAQEQKVPVLMTRYNTLETAEMIDHSLARIDPKDKMKIDLITEVVKRNLDLERIWS